ncbi:unnamed protein product [Prorocentrum cordatum]|uniref:DRBM domain-containing protein n=1 Tax=Prorocentrum cordatum TaxID=2364126 RepID=A0ABN9TPI2_9DINO|nr:unnamed protein product [Polarella glacialis]
MVVVLVVVRVVVLMVVLVVAVRVAVLVVALMVVRVVVLVVLLMVVLVVVLVVVRVVAAVVALVVALVVVRVVAAVVMPLSVLAVVLVILLVVVRVVVLAARRDAARRTLWYLQHPGYADAFQTSGASGSGAAASSSSCDGQAEARRAVDSPPVPWHRSCAAEPAVRRPTLADTEARLRRLLGLEGRPAEQVWQWSAKSLEGSSAAAPVRYRAAVRVPEVGRTFTGPWRHSAHKAEKAACALLEEFLDSWCKEPPPREAPLPPDPGRRRLAA